MRCQNVNRTIERRKFAYVPLVYLAVAVLVLDGADLRIAMTQLDQGFERIGQPRRQWILEGDDRQVARGGDVAEMLDDAGGPHVTFETENIGREYQQRISPLVLRHPRQPGSLQAGIGEHADDHRHPFAQRFAGHRSDPALLVECQGRNLAGVPVGANRTDAIDRCDVAQVASAGLLVDAQFFIEGRETGGYYPPGYKRALTRHDDLLFSGFALHAGHRDARYHVTAENQKYDQGRQRRHEGAGHHQIVLDIRGRDQGLQSDRNSPHVRTLEGNKRPEEFVPGKDEDEDRQGAVGRQRHRNDDMPQDTKVTATIEPGRVLEIGRQIDEELPQQEQADRQGRQWKKDAGESVEQADLLDDEEQRNGVDLPGDEHARQQQQEQCVASTPLQPRQRIGSERRDHHRDDRRPEGDLKGIEQPEEKRPLVQERPEVLERDRRRQPMRRKAHHFGRRLDCSRYHPDDRHDPDDRQPVIDRIFDWPFQDAECHHQFNSDRRPSTRTRAMLSTKMMANRMKPTAAAWPKLKDSKANRYIYRARTSDEVPGPPLVMMMT